MVNNTWKTYVVGDCGHTHRTWWKPSELAGATADCVKCGRLLIFDFSASDTHVQQIAVRGRDFNIVMNERDPRWPVDGANTGSAPF